MAKLKQKNTEEYYVPIKLVVKRARKWSERELYNVIAFLDRTLTDLKSEEYRKKLSKKYKTRYICRKEKVRNSTADETKKNEDTKK